MEGKFLYIEKDVIKFQSELNLHIILYRTELNSPKYQNVLPFVFKNIKKL